MKTDELLKRIKELYDDTKSINSLSIKIDVDVNTEETIKSIKYLIQKHVIKSFNQYEDEIQIFLRNREVWDI